MLDDKRLQLLGPLGLIAAFVCSELSARALGDWPASSFLWYVNLELFRSFRETPDALGDMQWLNAVGLAPPIAISIALAALIWIGVAARSRLPLAIAGNFSLIYSVCILYSSLVASDPAAISGIKLTALCNPASALAIAVLLASILSSTVSHRSYWREIFS
jgi:hypothetical protein